MENEPITPRVSRFTEGTMNSTNSIHPPPNAYWQELAIEEIIKSANEDSSSGPGIEATKERVAPSVSTPAPTAEGIFGRFSRAAASLFRSSHFSGLGKRKEREGEAPVKDTRKEEAERAYAEAKAMGLLPAPKVFVRPRAQPRSVATPRTTTSTPRDVSTPALRASQSKKDLNKQLKLSKQVSDLEHKLSKARKELNQVLNKSAKASDSALITFPPTPNSNFFSQDELSPHVPTEPKSNGKIIKKRKASAASSDEDSSYKPITTESESEFGGSEREGRKTRSAATTTTTTTTTSSAPSKTHKRARKTSTRLTKKKSTITKEEVVTVVPDGVTVPPIPSIPSGVQGKRAAVSSDDGFGGLGHEIF